MAQENNKEFSPVFLILACLFVMFLLLSNIIAGKLIQVFGLVLPAAVVLFPLTYLFGDVLTEVYGYRKSRLVIWVGFACNVLMALIFLAVIAIPHPSFWQNQNAYATVLGMTPRLVAASLLAYWAGEFSNSAILSLMKKLTGRAPQTGSGIEPMEIWAHQPKMMFAMGKFNQAVRKGKSVDERTKYLVELKGAQMIGCEFCVR